MDQGQISFIVAFSNNFRSFFRWVIAVLTLIFLAESTYRRVGQGTKANSSIKHFWTCKWTQNKKLRRSCQKRLTYERIIGYVVSVFVFRIKLFVFKQNNTRDHPEIDLWEYTKNKRNTPHFMVYRVTLYPLCRHLYWLTVPLSTVRQLITHSAIMILFRSFRRRLAHAQATSFLYALDTFLRS